MVNSKFPSIIPQQVYTELFVTFVITKYVSPLLYLYLARIDLRPRSASAPQPSFFDLPPPTKMPNEIFGTFTTPSISKPKFNSLNYLKALPASLGARFGEGEFHVVKMFSDHSLEPEVLDALYGRGNVAKTVEKVWLAYPKLDPVGGQEDFAPVRPDDGVYYVNGFERLISVRPFFSPSSAATY